MSVVVIKNLYKTFTLHQQQGVVLKVLEDVNLSVDAGQCVVLHGQSGAGKSTLMRTIYGNYLAANGQIQILHNGQMVDLVTASPREISDVRRHTLGYVSQFLRVIPRVSCLDVVLEPALARGEPLEQAKERAQQLLRRLNIPERLWSLAPGTFSGGEQQRVNIARSFMVHWPVMLLDEPTASLDERNSQEVLSLINERKQAGTAIIGIFHDKVARDAVADSYFDMNSQELSHAA